MTVQLTDEIKISIVFTTCLLWTCSGHGDIEKAWDRSDSSFLNEIMKILLSEMEMKKKLHWLNKGGSVSKTSVVWINGKHKQTHEKMLKNGVAKTNIHQQNSNEQTGTVADIRMSSHTNEHSLLKPARSVCVCRCSSTENKKDGYRQWNVRQFLQSA